MRLAVSNIAWAPEAEDAAAKLLAGLGVRAIELAPTKRWPDLAKAEPGDVAAYRAYWEDQGFEIVALQSIMFGRPDLVIFGDQATRGRTLKFLRHVISLSAGLGAQVIVFGSPKNRQRGELSVEHADDIAVKFFRQVGHIAAEAGVMFCIEPNAPAYACDFVTTAAAGHALVERVGSPGFGLHLDAACMAMVDDDPAEVTVLNPRHFHISAPMLEAVPSSEVPYVQFAASLDAIPYQYVVSIEMKAQPDGDLGRVREAVEFSQSVFGA